MDKKGPGSTLLDGPLMAAYSLALSHCCYTRRLLPAPFLASAGSPLIIQPGQPRLIAVTHVDA